MQVDPSESSTRDLYRHLVTMITPRPIAWVSTVSNDGVANLAPFSFFNGVAANPPTVLFCPANRRDGTAKDTLVNIRQNGQFVVNLVTEPLADAMNRSSTEWTPDVDEFEMTDLAKADSARVRPPRVAHAAGAFECELLQSIQLGIGPAGGNVVIGRVVWIHVDDRLVDPDGRIDAARLDTVGRMGGNGYVHTSDRFDLPRPDPPTKS